MKQLLRKILNSPIIISIILALLTVATMPPIVPRHKMHLNNNFSAPNRLYAYYQKADSSFSNVSFLRATKTSIILESVGKHLYYRQGLSYEDYLNIYCPLPPPKRDDICIEDLDQNNIQDILFVTQENDSIFLVHSTTTKPKTQKRIFLSKGGEIYYSFIRFFYFSEGKVYFTVLIKKNQANFENHIYSFNITTETVHHVHQFSTIVRGIQVEGINDHILFFSRNRNKSTFYDLDLATESCDTIPVNQLKIQSLFLSENSEILPYSYKLDHLFCHNGDSLFFLNTDKLIINGEIERHLVTSKNKTKDKFSIKYAKDGVAFYTIYNRNESALYKYDFSNDKSKRIRIKGKPLIKTIIYYGDIDGNGKNEIIFTNERNAQESYCICEEERVYSDVCIYPVGREDLKVGNSMRDGNIILFQSSGIERVVRYYKNPDYYKHWLWSSLLAIIIIFVGVFVQKMKEIRVYRKQQANSKILQLQLENVQKRIDPHFIFNSLNNLGSMILQGETHKSYDYLSQVSGVLYKALRIKGILVSVEEELNFCTAVLDTQRIRFEDKFDYEVYVDKAVDTKTLLPSNILNNMADNCIKHGFSGINYTGIISIEILRRRHGITVVIEDNGKGRKAAQADKDQSKSTGTGLEICHHYVQLLNHDRKTNKLSFKIIDLYDKGNPKGTRCEFYVPDKLNLES